jgi:hypothetical protein
MTFESNGAELTTGAGVDAPGVEVPEVDANAGIARDIAKAEMIDFFIQKITIFARQRAGLLSSLSVRPLMVSC